MMENEIRSEIFTVVVVQSGIPVVVEAFRDENIAQKRAAKLRSYINPENDEVETFQTVLQ